LFDSKKCKIRKEKSCKFVDTTVRTPRNIYVLNEIVKEICFLGKDDESWIWNRRMGHLNFDNLIRVKKREELREMFEISKPTNILCKHFLQGIQTKTKLKSNKYSTTKPLDIVHTNLVVSKRMKGLKCGQQFMLLVDYYTIMTIVFFLKKNSEAFENFKTYKEMVETETKLKVKCLRSENGVEFTSKDFMEFYSENGIKRKLLVARTPQQNGVFEINNRIIQEMARTMLMDSKLTYVFLVQVMHKTIHIHNIGMLINNSDKTIYKLWRGIPTNVNHFKVFKRKFYIKRENGKIGKFDSRVDKGILVGYSRKRKAYKCSNLRLNKIV
jgi:hypothetical protein